MLTNVQTSVQRCMLTFTLLISFFALSGYVNNSIPITRTLNTETLTAKPSIPKNVLSFQRASIAFYSIAFTCFIPQDNFQQSVILHGKFALTNYRHLIQLFLSYKSKFVFHFIAPSYPTEKTPSPIS
jgi:hypothetical protein